MLAAVHREGEVLDETTETDGMRLQARLEEASAKRLGDFIVGKSTGAERAPERWTQPIIARAERDVR